MENTDNEGKDKPLVRCSKTAMNVTSKMINVSYLIIVIIASGIIAYMLYLFLQYFGFAYWLNILIIVFIVIPLAIILIGLVYKRQCSDTKPDLVSLT